MEGKGAALAKRATDFALRVVRLFRALPECDEARVIGSQLLRSATSVAANYRAVCKARSWADSISNLGIVEEEADETVFWLEFPGAGGSYKESAAPRPGFGGKSADGDFCGCVKDSQEKQSSIDSRRPGDKGSEKR